jgi:hypothetical protein
VSDSKPTANGYYKERRMKLWEYEYYSARDKEKADGRPDGLFLGYTTFEFPSLALELYGGTAATCLLLKLYSIGTAKAAKATTDSPITCRFRMDKFAEKLGITVRAASRIVTQLEKDRFLERLEQGRSEAYSKAGEYGSAKFMLKKPGSNWALHAYSIEERNEFGFPQGILTANEYHSIIVVPREVVEPFFELPDAASRAVLLGGLEIVTNTGNECAYIKTDAQTGRNEWQDASHLSRTEFYKGVKTVRDWELLSYKKGVLAVRDPKTKKPNSRWKQRLGKDKGWTAEQRERYDYVVSRTPEENLKVLTAALPRIGLKEGDTKAHKWTKAKECPFCRCTSLHLHLHKRVFKCSNCTKRGSIHKKLLEPVLGQNFKGVVEFMKKTLRPDDNACLIELRESLVGELAREEIRI